MTQHLGNRHIIALHIFCLHGSYLSYCTRASIISLRLYNGIGGETPCGYMHVLSFRHWRLKAVNGCNMQQPVLACCPSVHPQ